MKLAVLTAFFGICTAAPQFLSTNNNPAPYAHEAVVLHSAMEALLPSGLKNHIYDNPETAAALAEYSWLSNKEMQVINRAADKIPRQKIFDVLQHAGLAR